MKRVSVLSDGVKRWSCLNNATCDKLLQMIGVEIPKPENISTVVDLGNGQAVRASGVDIQVDFDISIPIERFMPFYLIDNGF